MGPLGEDFDVMSGQFVAAGTGELLAEFVDCAVDACAELGGGGSTARL